MIKILNILPKLKNKNYYSYGIDTKSNFNITNINQNKNYSKFDVRINIPGKKNYKKHNNTFA